MTLVIATGILKTHSEFSVLGTRSHIHWQTLLNRDMQAGSVQPWRAGSSAAAAATQQGGIQGSSTAEDKDRSGLFHSICPKYGQGGWHGHAVSQSFMRRSRRSGVHGHCLRGA